MEILMYLVYIAIGIFIASSIGYSIGYSKGCESTREIAVRIIKEGYVKKEGS